MGDLEQIDVGTDVSSLNCDALGVADTVLNGDFLGDEGDEFSRNDLADENTDVSDDPSLPPLAEAVLLHNVLPDYLQDGFFLTMFLMLTMHNPAWYAALSASVGVGGTSAAFSALIALTKDRVSKGKGLKYYKLDMQDGFPRPAILNLGRVEVQNIVLFLTHIMSRKYTKVLEK